MLELLGIVGSTILALCGVPQSVKCLRDKSSQGISWWFILMWLVGEVMVFFYVLFSSIDLILLVNYTVNVLVCLPILYYKIFDGGRMS